MNRKSWKHVHRNYMDVDGFLHDHYFAEVPLYDEDFSRHKFRMRKHIFLYILEVVNNDYFVQKRGATTLWGINPHTKIVADL